MGNFYDLTYFGDKTVKFKQEKLIEVLKEQTGITLDVYEEIKGGVCTAVCMAWIKSKYEPSSILGFHRAKDVKPADDIASKLIIQNAAPKQINYVKEFLESGEEKSVRTLAAGELLTFVEMIEEGEDFFEIIDRCRGKLSKDEAAIVCANIQDSETGHAIALFKPTANDLCFFDPNAGEYYVYYLNLEAFLRKYKGILSKEKWVYTLTTAYKINHGGT